MRMKIRPVLLVSLATLLLLAIAVDHVLFIDMAGFPDGYLSQQEGANLKLLAVFNGLSYGLAGWFLLLAFFAPVRDVSRPFVWSCAVYAGAILIGLAVEAYVLANLMDSMGG